MLIHQESLFIIHFCYQRKGLYPNRFKIMKLIDRTHCSWGKSLTIALRGPSNLTWGSPLAKDLQQSSTSSNLIRDCDCPTSPEGMPCLVIPEDLLRWRVLADVAVRCGDGWCVFKNSTEFSLSSPSFHISWCDMMILTGCNKLGCQTNINPVIIDTDLKGKGWRFNVRMPIIHHFHFA